MRLSNRALMVKDSVTLAIAAKAAQMKATGVPVVSLSAGEPDFDTPTPIAEAGIAAIRAGKTRYTAAAGLPELRKAACTLMERDFGIGYRPEEILITAGAKPAIHLALMAAMEPGDSVLVPAPFWVSYPDLIRVAGGTPVVMDAVPEQGFVHTGTQILAALRAHQARGVVVNSPNNPSGVVWTQAQVQELVEAAEYEDAWIISDEIYGRILYEGARHVSPAHLPEGKKRTLLVQGTSKSFAMTGWRIGFLAGPADLVAAAGRIQSQITGNTSTPVQHAAIEAFARDHSKSLLAMVDAFARRRHLILELLAGIPQVKVLRPAGAFYVVVDVREELQRRRIDDVRAAERLLDEAHLAVVPGSPFALPGWLRLSYAAADTEIREGIARLGRWLAKA